MHFMKTDVLAPGCAPYDPQAIWHARHAFFEDGKPPEGLVHEAVLRSWRRCSEAGRAVHEPVEFQPVERVGIRHLLDRHADLMAAARPELADLAASVADAGYAVLMTDVHGNVLAVDGAIAQRSGALRSAFRTGVDLSEGAIGTNAMAVAMREAHAVRVLGAEHFYTETQIFHCSAAHAPRVRGQGPAARRRGAPRSRASSRPRRC
jgi:transcriptional regulator of acetoin/glycerol metabolism